jgi:hypothetical protein
MVKGGSGKFDDDKKGQDKGDRNKVGDRDRRNNKGTEKRNDEGRERKQIEEISDEMMNEKMKKHFRNFVSHMEAQQNKEEPDED